MRIWVSRDLVTARIVEVAAVRTETTNKGRDNRGGNRGIRGRGVRSDDSRTIALYNNVILPFRTLSSVRYFAIPSEVASRAFPVAAPFVVELGVPKPFVPGVVVVAIALEATFTGTGGLAAFVPPATAPVDTLGFACPPGAAAAGVF